MQQRKPLRRDLQDLLGQVQRRGRSRTAHACLSGPGRLGGSWSPVASWSFLRGGEGWKQREKTNTSDTHARNSRARGCDGPLMCGRDFDGTRVSGPRLQSHLSGRTLICGCCAGHLRRWSSLWLAEFKEGRRSGGLGGSREPG